MRSQYMPDFKCDVKGLVTAFSEKIKDGYNFRGEMHNFWELVCIWEGKAIVSEDDRVYELGAGNVIFHKPMEFHKIRVEKGSYARMMVISFYANDSAFERLGDGVFELDAEKKNHLEEVFSLIEEYFDLNFYVEQKAEPDPVGEKITYLNFELFLLSILSAESRSNARQSSQSAINYKNIIDVMKDNIDKNLSASEIAAMCNLSESNVKKIFAKYTDGGVIKHFNRLKIKRAMRLLKAGHSVSETSDMLGFLNPSYFAVVFQREAGELPSHYRQSQKDKWRNLT